jgi:hypothetical protein
MIFSLKLVPERKYVVVGFGSKIESFPQLTIYTSLFGVVPGGKNILIL